ncbi:hypothetical protein EBX31_00100 [bacterium]|nr:hypothetical protein [bacterium]
MRVAIMQPTYLPWAGYFGLMQAVDLFIFLDSVQFAKRSWQQRNQIKTPQGPLWLTIPVLSKGKQEQTIREVVINQDSDFPSHHRKAIELNYKKARFFDAYEKKLFDQLQRPASHMVEITLGLIYEIKSTLGIETKTALSSELKAQGAKAELLASLCQAVGATEYISPPGSREYLKDSKAFQKNGLNVSYFDFRHPEYPQLFGEFLPYMSCIDLLFNCGSDSPEIIKKNSFIVK